MRSTPFSWQIPRDSIFVSFEMNLKKNLLHFKLCMMRSAQRDGCFQVMSNQLIFSKLSIFSKGERTTPITIGVILKYQTC